MKIEHEGTTFWELLCCRCWDVCSVPTEFLGLSDTGHVSRMDSEDVAKISPLVYSMLISQRGHERRAEGSDKRGWQV